MANTGSGSTTVTRKVQSLVLPAGSAAVQVTTVIPTGKADPLAGAQTRLATEHKSPASGLKLTSVLHAPRSAAVTMSWQVSVGGWRSSQSQPKMPPKAGPIEGWGSTGAPYRSSESRKGCSEPMPITKFTGVVSPAIRKG